VKGCFDEIHLTDTGSTDGSIELIETYAKGPNPADASISLHHFKWVDDFAAARNASFDPAKTDYSAWLDLDDILSDRDQFISWRNEVMLLADFWVATYHYAITPEGRPACSFARERVIRNGLGLKWKYFVHEGIIPKTELRHQFATNWTVNHMRTDEDQKADRSRNLKLFQNRLDSLDARMTYYYGKELFENNDPMAAFQFLLKAIAMPDLEIHDRILGIQYACLAAGACNQFERTIHLAHNGLQLAPNRAEFFVFVGDAYLKLNKANEAIPYFNAAKACQFQDPNALMTGPTFVSENAYKAYPRMQLARLYFHQGQMDKALKEIEEVKVFGPHVEASQIEAEILRIKSITDLVPKDALAKTDEIVISCHPNGLYEWDDRSLTTYGIGGSETAVVQMAEWLSVLSGRLVRVFNNRTEKREVEGIRGPKVIYQPASQVNEYFKKFEPAVHIAWRHTAKLTNAPTYIWCHDLFAPGIENSSQYEGVLALSNFHKSYLHNLFRVPLEKIRVIRNGIDPERFKNLDLSNKNPRKVVFSSSPDRGLDRTIDVMDIVHSDLPDVELHCYYGFDNMLKMGKTSEVDAIKRKVHSRPWIKWHGNLPQDKLAEEFATAAIWLYPTDFLETFCITALEMLCCGVYPIVRKWGGLQDTLKTSSHMGMCDMIDSDCRTIEERKLYADRVIKAIAEEKWLNVKAEPAGFSWAAEAREWLEWLPLSK